jgi:hypothetical protein
VQLAANGGRIPGGGGWRAHGRHHRPAARPGSGFAYVHAAIDDHGRRADAKIHTDECGAAIASVCLASRSTPACGVAISGPGTNPSTGANVFTTDAGNQYYLTLSPADGAGLDTAPITLLDPAP